MRTDNPDASPLMEGTAQSKRGWGLTAAGMLTFAVYSLASCDSSPASSI